MPVLLSDDGPEVYISHLEDVVSEQKTEIERLREELDAWRDCVMIDALMEGPQFKGFNRSTGARVFKKYWSVKETPIQEPKDG